MKRLCTLGATFICALVLGCSSSTGSEPSRVSGNWVSVETYMGRDESGNLRVSIDPVTDPSVLTGSFSLGTTGGRIEDGGLSGSDIALTLGTFYRVRLTGTVSSDAIEGTLSGTVPGGYEFNGTPVTLRRGS